MKLKTNTKAPNFKLPCTDKSIFQLSKIKKKNIILYFYPKDDTPGCTIESKDFSKLNNLISKNNSIVFGISKDSIKSHLKFKKKYKLKFNLSPYLFRSVLFSAPSQFIAKYSTFIKSS